MSAENTIDTFSGKRIDVIDPNPDDICIEDIAHALSNLCRFTGHTREFYSVAQHSVYVSVHVSRENALWGLMHDATEAYINDIARPVKVSDQMKGYREIERKLKFAVATKFKLGYQIPEEVLYMDNVMILTEARDLGINTDQWNWSVTFPPLKSKIYPQQPKDAERSFLEWFEIINREDWLS